MAQDQEPGETPDPPGPSRPDDTQAFPGPDATQPHRPIDPDATRPQGRFDETAQLPTDPQPWTARASVRPPGPAARPQLAEADWSPVDDGERKWWLPILWGILALLLIALIGVGIWWFTQSSADEPGVTASVVPSASIVPSSAKPSSKSPSPSPTPTEQATDVEVPELEGLSLEQARADLTEAGLAYQLEFQASDDQPADSVIGSDPPAGTTVPEGTRVTLFIAEAPAATPTRTAPTPTTSADD